MNSRNQIFTLGDSAVVKTSLLTGAPSRHSLQLRQGSSSFLSSSAPRMLHGPILGSFDYDRHFITSIPFDNYPKILMNRKERTKGSAESRSERRWAGRSVAAIA